MISVEELKKMDGNDGLAVSAEEGNILMELVKRINPKSVCEVGTGNGYSTAWMLHGLNSEGTIYTVDKEKRFHIFEENERIKFMEGTLDNHIDEIPEDLDIVFLDSEHMIHRVSQDIEIVLPNIKKGSVVVIHDVKYRPTLGNCLMDYFNGISSDSLSDNGCSPSKFKWKYSIEDTLYGLGIAVFGGERG
jgi:predicted O-methyltransferase YrrM